MPSARPEDLHLDMAYAREVALDQHGAVTEHPLGERRGPCRTRSRSAASSVATAMPMPPPPAAALTITGIADRRRPPRPRRRPTRPGRVVPGRDRYAGRGHQVACVDLVAHRADRLGGRTDPDQPGRLDRAGELGVLGEEAVAGVDRLRAGGLGRAAGSPRRCGSSAPGWPGRSAPPRRPRPRTAGPRRPRSRRRSCARRAGAPCGSPGGRSRPGWRPAETRSSGFPSSAGDTARLGQDDQRRPGSRPRGQASGAARPCVAARSSSASAVAVDLATQERGGVHQAERRVGERPAPRAP